MWPTPRAADHSNAKSTAAFRVKHGDSLVGATWDSPPAPGDTVNRTHRLKALGNGIVVMCAIPFALAIADVLGLTDAD